MKLFKKDKPEKTTEKTAETQDEENTLFSVFDVSIEYPRNWKVIFSPKTPPDYNSGFVRIENFIPRRGAQVSLSLNWQRAEGTNEEFALSYCKKISDEYKKHMKKKPCSIERAEVVDLNCGKGAYVVTEYKAGLGLVKRNGDIPVRTLQLAFYDESTGRAVVSSVIGVPDAVREKEDFLKELVFSVNSRQYGK